MKKFRGLLAIAVALTVVCASFATVSAKGFADVSASKYAWCVNEISAMADDGIISGYTDGTFKPENTVTKLEALALVARVLGSREEVNASLVEKAKELHEEKIEDYSLSFGTDEICYLLLKGVLFEDELDDYLAGGAANEGMKRYEVAVLLTKGMGAEQEVKDKVTAVLDYTDTLQIPTTARKYVEYVTAQGLMQGMGDNTFAPLNNVTRAQAALVLYKLQDLTSYDMFKGIVASYDQDTRTIRFKLADDTNKAYTVLPKSVTLRCDGDAIEPDDIKVGWEAVVTTQNDMLYVLDFLTAQSDGIISGKLVSVAKATDATTLKVEDMTSANGGVVSYKTADNVAITYSGSEGKLTDLAVGDYVKLTIKNNKITIINAEPAKKTVKGTITAIDLTDGVSMTIKSNDVEEIYPVATNVKVAKNSDSATMTDIMVGDKATVKLEYNVITSIDATSTTTSDTGIIQSINIAQTPTISIKIGTKTYEYPVARNAKILLNGEEGTIYDLRINTNATITLESDSIVKIDTTPIAEDTDVQGQVVGVNVSYNLIQVKYVDAVSGTENVEQVFVKTGARIISTNSSTDKKLKDVEVGQTITAMGSRSSGVFEATTVIIRN